MHQSASVFEENTKVPGFSISGEFDGLKTFQEIYDAMPPISSVKSLVLDFSQVSQVKPIELYALLAEMAAVPRFRHIEISIEGLRFDHASDKSSQTESLRALSREGL